MYAFCGDYCECVCMWEGGGMLVCLNVVLVGFVFSMCLVQTFKEVSHMKVPDSDSVHFDAHSSRSMLSLRTVSVY